MNGYELSRRWFDFSFEEPKCKVQHTSIFFWIVELNNRLGWKKQFGLPTREAIEVLSIGNKNTYLSALKDLEKWGFIKIITPAKNQNQSCIVEICRIKNDTARGTALDTAVKQQCNNTSNSGGNGTDPIDKPLNQEQLNQEPLTEDELLTPSDFDQFWEAYGKQQGRYPCEQLWRKLEQNDIDKILEHVPKFVKASGEYLINPKKYLEDRRWMDEDLPDYSKEQKNNTPKGRGKIVIPL